jgi:hypothetical protein
LQADERNPMLQVAAAVLALLGLCLMMAALMMLDR